MKKQFLSQRRKFTSALFALALVAFISAPFFIVKNNSVSANNQNNFASPEAIFTNANPITINDSGNANPYPSTITVSGLSGTVLNTPGSIKVTLNGFSHTYPDDLAIVLVGPTGAAFLIQDGVTAGGNNVPGQPASNITYTISDSGATPLPNDNPLTPGTFKPAAYYQGSSFPAPGPGLSYSSPAPAGSATFSSVFGGTNPNGNWNLFIVDFTAGDGGSISGGWGLEVLTSDGGTPSPSPTVSPTGTPIPTPTATGSPQRPPVDFNGDGRTDYVTARSAASTLPSFWFIHNGTSIDAKNGQQWGQGVSTPNYGFFDSNTGAVLGDIAVPADYDGDRITDFAVWRSGTQGFFYILRSSNNTLQIERFGQTGDDPTVVRDYDGDGKVDVAVYRTGTTNNSQNFFYYRPSGTAGVDFRGQPWGQALYDGTGDYTGDYPYPADYDGDGRGDYVVQRPLNNTAAVFIILKSSGGIEYVYFGSSSDFLIPGDYDGDGKTDICTRRTINNARNYFIRYANGATQSYVFGQGAITGQRPGDVECPGDYNGDGKTDICNWRPSPTTGQQAVFYVLPTTGAAPFSFPWGASSTDVPVANYPIH